MTKNHEHNREIDIPTIILIACDITTVLGYSPEIDAEIHDHLIWSASGEYPDVLLCNGTGNLTCRSDLSRDEFLALIGVATLYKYEFNQISIETVDSIDDANITNLFRNNLGNTH